MDTHDRQDCEYSISHVRELLDCGIFEPANGRHPLLQSAFIDLIICLRDLLHKAERYARRISFTEIEVLS